MDATDDPLASESAVTQFIQRALSNREVSGIELSMGEFEDTRDFVVAKFLIDTERGNPLKSGLAKIDSMSAVVKGKNRLGVGQFNDLPSISVTTIQRSTPEELIPFILNTLDIFTPVTSGVLANRVQANRFNALSISIAKQLKRGGEIYQTYINDVISIGTEVIKEWVNNGGG